MRLFFYLTKDIISHALAVAFVLFLVVFAGRFIRYLAEAAVGSLTADVLLPVMLFKLPSFFELILPLALFIGILLSLGRLYAESEMVVMRACGMGPLRLSLYVSVTGVAVMVIVAWLTLVLAPEGSARAQRLLDNPRNAEGLQLMASGRFKSQRGGELVTYAEFIDDQGVMHNVFVAERRSDDDSLRVTRAREAEIVTDPDNQRRYLELRDGTRFEGVPGAVGYEALRFAMYGELIPEDPKGLRATTRIDALPSGALIGSENPRERATLWWRLSLPLLVPVVTLIALALSRTDARRGQYARLGPALGVFLVYFLCLTQARSHIEGGGGVAGFVATHLGFALLALLLLAWDSLTHSRRKGASAAL
jgi:lipopolysaccharide export system permease protein